jgi:hypothetical protein
MPLCPQITITPITVTSTGMTQTSVIAANAPATTEQLTAVDAEAAAAAAEAAAAAATAAAASTAAAAAATAAGAAQATANTALANAATAYTAAIGSLQPSANTIVNASNQMTAINSGGITVYSGASATSGARVVLNSAGLAGFNSGGTATFSISASTGAAVFSGSVTGATITASTMNIGGNAIIDASGLLTATGATITGDIRATAGYFGTATNGFSISSTGLVGVGTGTIVGGTIQGVTFNNGSGTFSVSSAGFLTATSGLIGGWSVSSTAISKVVGTKTLTLDSSNAIITINDTSTGILSGGGINMTAGSTTGSYGAGGIAFASTGTAAILFSASDLLIQGGATTGITLRPGAGLGLQVQVDGVLNSFTGSLSAGTHTGTSTSQTAGAFIGASGAIIARRDNAIPYFAHKFNASGTTEMIRLIYNGSDAGGITTTSGGVPAFRNASDYRLKQNIQSFDSAASLIKQINLHSFEFIRDPEEPQVGFIAHELAEVLPALVMGEKDAVDENGDPVYQSILATNLIPYLTGALKEAILRIEALEGA